MGFKEQGRSEEGRSEKMGGAGEGGRVWWREVELLAGMVRAQQGADWAAAASDDTEPRPKMVAAKREGKDAAEI